MSLQSRTGTRRMGSCHQPHLGRKKSDCLREGMSLQQERGPGPSVSPLLTCGGADSNSQACSLSRATALSGDLTQRR